MTRHTPTALWLAAALAAAGCNAKVIDDGDEDEPILLGPTEPDPDPDPDPEPEPDPDPEECPDPPTFCSGMWSQDDAGCTICVSGGCDDLCTADEICSTCNYANGAIVSCHEPPSPDPDQFACQWTVCAVGEICQDIQPAGDGCPDAACAPLPAACESDPTCACIEAAFGASSCSQDDAGNVTVSGYFF